MSDEVMSKSRMKRMASQDLSKLLEEFERMRQENKRLHEALSQAELNIEAFKEERTILLKAQKCPVGMVLVDAYDYGRREKVFMDQATIIEGLNKHIEELNEANEALRKYIKTNIPDEVTCTHDFHSKAIKCECKVAGCALVQCERCQE